MTTNPFLEKFARIVLDDNTSTKCAESSQDGNEKSQGRLMSTIVTKVNRETTDDQ